MIGRRLVAENRAKRTRLNTQEKCSIISRFYGEALTLQRSPDLDNGESKSKIFCLFFSPPLSTIAFLFHHSTALFFLETTLHGRFSLSESGGSESKKKNKTQKKTRKLRRSEKTLKLRVCVCLRHTNEEEKAAEKLWKHAKQLNLISRYSTLVLLPTSAQPDLQCHAVACAGSAVQNFTQLRELIFLLSEVEQVVIDSSSFSASVKKLRLKLRRNM